MIFHFEIHELHLHFSYTVISVLLLFSLPVTHWIVINTTVAFQFQSHNQQLTKLLSNKFYGHKASRPYKKHSQVS